MNEYTCDKCGNTYEKGWTEDEARAEHIAMYGRPPDPDTAVLCDPCWVAFAAWFSTLTAEDRQRIEAGEV